MSGKTLVGGDLLKKTPCFFHVFSFASGKKTPWGARLLVDFPGRNQSADGRAPFVSEIQFWLVVWNIFYFSTYWESSSQLTNIFSEGLKPPTRIEIFGVGPSWLEPWIFDDLLDVYSLETTPRIQCDADPVMGMLSGNALHHISSKAPE